MGFLPIDTAIEYNGLFLNLQWILTQLVLCVGLLILNIC